MRAMRRKDRQMDEAEARALLEKGEYGTLATVGGDGQPYGVPVNYVVEGERLYFHCATKGHKLENIAAQPKVCFTVVGKTQPVFTNDFTTFFESAIAFGTAVLVEEEAEKNNALQALCLKYLPEHADKIAGSIAQAGKITAVVRIDIEHISGKAQKPR